MSSDYYYTKMGVEEGEDEAREMCKDAVAERGGLGSNLVAIGRESP